MTYNIKAADISGIGAESTVCSSIFQINLPRSEFFKKGRMATLLEPGADIDSSQIGHAISRPVRFSFKLSTLGKSIPNIN